VSSGWQKPLFYFSILHFGFLSPSDKFVRAEVEVYPRVCSVTGIRGVVTCYAGFVSLC
jgi:hypothetical protein